MAAHRSRKSPKPVRNLAPKILSAKQAKGVKGGLPAVQSQLGAAQVNALCDGSVNKVVNVRGKQPGY